MTIATKKALEELNGLKLMEYFKESKPKNYLDVMNAMRVKGIL
jgi:hypothetical protein